MPNRSRSPEQNRVRVRRAHLSRMWEEWVGTQPLPQLDRWVSHRLKRERAFGKRDRLWYADMIFAMARFAATAVAQHAPDSRRHCPLVDSVRALPAETVARTALERADAPEPPPSDADPEDWLAWYGMPCACDGLLEQRAGMSAWTPQLRERFVRAHATRPPLWLRLHDPAQEELVLTELARRGFAVEQHGPALAVAGSPGVYTLNCYRNGLVEIQDAASQAIGTSVGARPGEFVWDCCTGGGGKALQLAGAMGNTGALYASDIRSHALVELRRRAARAGIRIVRSHVWDAVQPPDFGAAHRTHGGFDRVLVDAPCSGSGTWRRNPDGRLRFDPSALVPLTELQHRLLHTAVQAVRPGGQVVYATCSWLVCENEDVVTRVCARQSGLTVVSTAIHGNPCLDADTTFSAVLKRASG